ncbi:MAG: exonuclease domain-containing protein [Burkholderiaceae bacterium]
MLRDSPKLAFVDVETTGGSPTTARITEVAIVIVWWPADAIGPPHCTRWSSLVNPGVPVPTEISYLTGIDNAMVANAPRFDQLAPRIISLLNDAVFVAHHARFDYGFIKTELARSGHAYTSPTLCTVRLSRMLHPDRSPHTLDALIIRHKLPCDDRHRALGDAQVLWHFLVRMFRDHGIEQVNEAAQRLLKKPNLPAHLGIESVEHIPPRPGIYFFHGLNAHPLYIGKSKNIRQRIASHFCGDHTSERGIRLASETRRISWQETPGEFSALLAEIRAIDNQMPAHNRALRRHQQSVAFRFNNGDPKPIYQKLSGEPAANKRAGTLAISDNPGSGDLYGPFTSRAAARSALQKLATTHHWCQNRLGLTRSSSGNVDNAGKPCFARQLGRCTGACVGAIDDQQLLLDMAAELEALRIDRWPNTPLLVIETGFGLATWHLFDRWCWLASGAIDAGITSDRDTSSQSAILDTVTRIVGGSLPPLPERYHFDRNIYALLKKHFGHLPDFALPGATTNETELPDTGLPDTNTLHWHEANGERLNADHQLSACWLAGTIATAAETTNLTDPAKSLPNHCRQPIKSLA